jgi:hypothetical protein
MIGLLLLVAISRTIMPHRKAELYLFIVIIVDSHLLIPLSKKTLLFNPVAPYMLIVETQVSYFKIACFQVCVAVLCCAVLCCAVLCCTMLFYILLCFIALCCTGWCSVVFSCDVLFAPG